jgi:hypothetical protein
VEKHKVDHFKRLLCDEFLSHRFQQERFKGVMIRADQFLHKHVELLSLLGADARDKHPALRFSANSGDQLPKGGLNTRSDWDFRLRLQFPQLSDIGSQIKSKSLDDRFPKGLFRAKVVRRQCRINSSGCRNPTQTGALKAVPGECGLACPEQKQRTIGTIFARSARTPPFDIFLHYLHLPVSSKHHIQRVLNMARRSTFGDGSMDQPA